MPALAAALLLLGPPAALGGFDGSRMREVAWYGRPSEGFVDSAAAFVDLDRDGRDEWIAAGRDGWAVLRSDPGSGRRELVRGGEHVSATGSEVASVLLADITGDGIPELHVLWYDEDWTIRDIRDGKRLGSQRLYASLGRRYAVLADADPSPGIELVLGHGDLVEVYARGRAAPLWMIPVSGQVAGLWAGNVDGDPATEILVAMDSAEGLVLDAGTRRAEWSWPPGFRGHLALGDLDGDGVSEIVAAGADGRVRAIDGQSRTERWSRTLGRDERPSILDADGDGRNELALVRETEILLVDGTTGLDLASGALPRHAPASAAFLAELDGDCGAELGWTLRAPGGLRFAAPDTLELEGEELLDLVPGEHSLALSDLDGDGCQEAWLARRRLLAGNLRELAVDRIDLCRPRPEEWFRLADAGFSEPALLVLASGSNVDLVLRGGHDQVDLLSAFDARSGTPRWQSIPLEGPVSALAAGDVDGDGIPELGAAILGGNEAWVRLFTPGDGAPLARRAAGARRDPVGLRMQDLDGDGRAEVVAGSGDRLSVLAGPDLAERARVDWPQASAFELADVDGDGALELLVGDEYGQVAGLDPLTLQVRFQEQVSTRMIVSLAAADLDGDGAIEILAAERSYGGSVATARPLVLRGADRSRLWTGPDIAARNGLFPTLAAGETDDDGKRELLVTSDNGLFVFEYDPGPADLAPPEFPAGAALSASADAAAGCCPVIRLDWPEARDAASPPCRYRVYRDAAAGFPPGPASLLVETALAAAEDLSAAPGSAWYYLVTAVDEGGNESPALAEVGVTAPVGDVLPPDQGNVLRAWRRAADVVLDFPGAWSRWLRVHGSATPDRSAAVALSGDLLTTRFELAGAVASGGPAFYDLRGVSACSGAVGP